MDNQERIIQYRFTAYLMESIKNHKTKYVRKKEIRQQIETLVGDFNEILTDLPVNNESNSLAPENAAFEKALEKIKARDMQILVLHLLEKYSLKEISVLLDINYNTVTSSYSRAVKKIRSEMGDDNHEF